MNEPQVHAIPEEISGVMKSLEQCQSHVSLLGTNVADFQKAIQGLDTTVRLIVEAMRVNMTAEESADSQAAEAAASAAATAAAPDAPARYGQESWFEPLWRGVVALVNAQIAAVGRPGEAPLAIAPSAAQVLTRFRADRLQPLREILGPLHRKLGHRDAAADPDLKPAADRYLALRQAVDRLTDQVLEWEGEQGSEQFWSGELPAGNLLPDSLVTQVERDGKLIPQIDFSALRELEAEVNRQIAERCAVVVPDAVPANATPDRFGKLDSEFQDLLAKLVDLKHSLAEAQARKEQFGQSTDRIREPLKLLQTKLHELEVDEIEIQRGDRVNSRLHTVVSREADPRLGAGEITRVLVAGYRYRGEVKRMAQVVATA
jgi:hypothetical protein